MHMHTFSLVEGNAKEKQYQANLITDTLTSQKGLPTAFKHLPFILGATVHLHALEKY